GQIAAEKPAQAAPTAQPIAPPPTSTASPPPTGGTEGTGSSRSVAPLFLAGGGAVVAIIGGAMLRGGLRKINQAELACPHPAGPAARSEKPPPHAAEDRRCQGRRKQGTRSSQLGRRASWAGRSCRRGRSDLVLRLGPKQERIVCDARHSRRTRCRHQAALE